MLSVAAAANAAAEMVARHEDSLSSTEYEHLHLHMIRTHWATKYHDNLGAHLQDAFDILDREGWQVVAAYCVVQTPEIILRRRRCQSPL